LSRERGSGRKKKRHPLWNVPQGNGGMETAPTPRTKREFIRNAWPHKKVEGGGGGLSKSWKKVMIHEYRGNCKSTGDSGTRDGDMGARNLVNRDGSETSVMGCTYPR